MKVAVLDPHSPSWPAEVDRLRGQLGAPDNPTLFPPQFLKVTLPNIGGRIVRFEEGSCLLGGGFLFPRALQDGVPLYTLRFHAAVGAVDPIAWVTELEDALEVGRVVVYDPRQEQHYGGTTWLEGQIEIGRPGVEEAAVVRSLQQQIWGSESDFLYPADIHSEDFCAGTSLVARHGGQIIGCLFGFYKFGVTPLPPPWSGVTTNGLCIESQLMGILPQYRGQGVGFLLKRAQAELALEEGIDLLNWTADPLQWANAVLNFGKLRAIACHFHPDYYPYRNVLNQVSASRLEIAWAVRSQPVHQALQGVPRAAVLDLTGEGAILRLHPGWQPPLPGHVSRIAIEIPRNWTAIQREDSSQARAWREQTDRVFQWLLGHEEGRFVITGVDECSDQTYLVAERVSKGWQGDPRTRIAMP